MKHYQTICAGFLLLLLLGGVTASPLLSENAEDEIKAAVLLGFVRYSEWPPSVSSNEPIVVGVSARQPFAATLKRVMAGKTSSSHPIKVVEWSAMEDSRNYQVVYFAADSGIDNKAISKLAARGSPLLIVGDAIDMLDVGGAIRLMLVDGRMSFEFRLDVLERTGLNISSKLLRFGQMRKTTTRTP